MKKLLAVLLFSSLMLPVAASTPSARPEELGLSSERLKRITELVQRHIDNKSFSGAVTLVARQGRIAHFEAQGLMDIESRKPMQKDAIFQIMSMTKPVVGVSILMMMEEGKVRLTDPVSRFIPEFKELQVAVPQPAPAGAPAATDRNAPPRYYTVPADREVTIRDLLSHTSGLASGTISSYTARGIGPQGKEGLADVVPRLGKTALEFQPGTRWAYSATAGFDTLARDRRDRIGSAIRSVRAAADLRTPRHARHVLLSRRRQSTDGHPLLAYGRRPAAETRQRGLHERSLLLRRRRPVQHG